MLRASVEVGGDEANLEAVTGAAEGAVSGVAHGAELVRFAEAVLGDDDAELDAAREALKAAVGPEGLVDAAGVVANFKRMVRIADGTGIPLDAPLELFSQDLREDLRLERFGSSANTPEAGALRRAIGRVLRPVAFAALRRLGGDRDHHAHHALYAALELHLRAPRQRQLPGRHASGRSRDPHLAGYLSHAGPLLRPGRCLP